MKRISFPSITGRMIVRGFTCACGTISGLIGGPSRRPASSGAIANELAHKSATKAQRIAKHIRTIGLIVP